MNNTENNYFFISLLIILWLIIPYAAFITTFYEWYVLIPNLFLVGYFLYKLLLDFNKKNILIPLKSSLVAAISSFFVIGASGLLLPISMTGDWYKHFAIAQLLSESHTWPPLITRENITYFLRYNIAFYEVPALLERIWPIGIKFWIYFYEWLGLTLFFILLSLTFNTSKPVNVFKNFIGIIIFIGFSGLDILGAWYTNTDLTDRSRLEWWAWLSSFSSIKNQLDWMPQHSLAIWLGSLLLYLNSRHNGNILKEFIFILIGLMFFWSPLACIGLLLIPTIYLKEAVLSTKTNPGRLIFLLVVVFTISPLWLYFASSSDAIPKYLMLDFSRSLIASLKEVLIFLILEAYVYIFLIISIKKDSHTKSILINLLIVLGLSSIIHVGVVFNDFSLKVSIAALCLLAIILTHTFIDYEGSFKANKKNFLALIAVYSIGLVTPSYYFLDAYQEDRIDYVAINKNQRNFEWLFQRNRSYPDQPGFYVQYFAPESTKPFFIRDQR